MAALREALGEYLLPSHNWCGKRAEFSWSLKWLKVLFSFTSCWFWKCQNESTCLFITLFQYCLERSLLIFCRRYSGSGRSYLCNMCLTLINQLELSSVFTRSWRRAIWYSIVEGSMAIFMNVVNILMSIWASMVFAPTKAKTATLAVLSGRFWSCFNTFLWYSSKSVRSFFLISRSSIPCRSLGRTKVFHICIVITGDIPFLPCIPLPNKAYIVFLAVSIRFWVSGVLFSFLFTPRCIAWLTWDIFCPLAGLVPPLLVFLLF